MSMPDTQSPPVLDPAWLERMLARPDFARHLFEVFLADEPARVEAMGKAIADGDMEKLRFLAHSLKGASATLGMPRVSSACRELEQASKAGDTQRMSEAYALVEKEMEAVYAGLRAVMPSE